ncbi:MAG: carbohydrate kinase [Desulfocapsaceae bacterium]|nr:carbohydrate kinase [Desulfocapsaceae bacterium]
MGEKTTFTMVGIGEVLWDILPQGKQLGGAPANFACHASQLGNNGVIFSSVGKDSLGTEILEVLDKKNVGHIISVQDKYPTGTVSVELDSEGAPTYTIHEDVAWDHIRLEKQHKKFTEKADVICYGSLACRHDDSAKSIFECIEATPSTCIRLFDVNLRQDYYDQETILKLLEAATVLKLNDEELLVVAHFLDISGSETTLLQLIRHTFDLDLIILTKGEHGSRLFSRELGDSILKGQQVKVVDTIGAGDSFAGAVATGLCLDMPLEKIHQFADNVAAYVCSQAGATPELPPLGELLHGR